MSTATPPLLKYSTRCRVPGCNQEFSSSPLDIPIIGAPGERVLKFVTGLLAHLQKKHPEIAQRMAGAIQEYTGFLVVSMFECADPQLNELRERVRATLHQFSTRFRISDEQIQERIAALALADVSVYNDKAAIEEGLNTLLQDFRDVLLEQGRYAPQNGQPAEKPLIVPAKA